MERKIQNGKLKAFRLPIPASCSYDSLSLPYVPQARNDCTDIFLTLTIFNNLAESAALDHL